MYDTIIISDIHLGSAVCQSRQIRKFLSEVELGTVATREIVLNGDLFDSWDFRKLKGSQWKVLSQLRRLSKERHVVWINGNHDGPAEIISHLLGLDFVDEYEISSGGRKILVVHGDRFDNFIVRHPFLTKLADWVYRLIQRMDGSFRLARMAKRNSKTFLRCSEQVRERALEYCSLHGFDLVCCGHTHLAEASGKYYNSGCWTELPCHYLTVLDGVVNLHSWSKNFERGVDA